MQVSLLFAWLRFCTPTFTKILSNDPDMSQLNPENTYHSPCRRFSTTNVVSLTRTLVKTAQLNDFQRYERLCKHVVVMRDCLGMKFGYLKKNNFLEGWIDIL